MAKKILISQPVHEAGIKALTDKGYEARVSPDISAATLAREIKDCAGLLVRTAEIPASVINAAPALKVIARHGVGYDNIDLDAATKKGVVVAITPRANAVAVAEHVLALMLAFAKRIIPYDAATRKNEWELRNSYSAFDLDGKVLAVLGMGRIGMLVCQKAKAAFNMDVLAYDPIVPREAMEKAGGRVMTSIPEMLKLADFVTLHVPSMPETKGLIGDAQFRLMKRTAFLVNCARGPIVDEAALVRALKNNTIAGAGIDVFDPEPPKADNPLFGLPNAILSPHSAGLTVECVIRMATHAAEAIMDVLEGRRPEGVVNPQVYK